MKLNSHKEVRRNYFFSKYSIEYTLRVSTTPTVKTAFVCSCLGSLIPSVVVSGGELANVKGREPEGSEGASGVSGDLILKLSGTLPVQEEEDADEDLEDGGEEPQSEPWSIDSFSVFKEFRGSHDIVYECHPRSSLDERALSDLGVFLAISDAEVHRFELYLEMFSSRFFSSLLGFAPVVLQKLSLVAYDDELLLSVSHEQLPSATTFPLTQRQFREALQELYLQYFQLDILEDAEQAGSKTAEKHDSSRPL